MTLPVLVLSMHDESLYAERAIRAGAKGYITKDEASDNVIHILRKILSGGIYLSDGMTTRLLKMMAEGGKKLERAAVDRLTDRELDVYQLIGKGKTAREIATTLNLGLTTIDTYRARIKEKLNLKSGTELAFEATTWLKTLN